LFHLPVWYWIFVFTVNITSFAVNSKAFTGFSEKKISCEAGERVCQGESHG
jgi:hypothetical protein